jgi:hypothetical protein
VRAKKPRRVHSASDPRRPRVMRRRPARAWRSVGRGTCRPGYRATKSEFRGVHALQTAGGNIAGGAFASCQGTPRGQRTRACTSGRENREIPRSPTRLITGWAAQGTQGGTPEMHEGGKLDRLVVPANPSNKAVEAVAEVGEGRRRAKGNTASKPRPGRSAGSDASSALGRVREVARRDRNARFTALLHHVGLGRLPGGVLGDSPAGRAGGGRGDVGRVRAGPGGQPPGR